MATCQMMLRWTDGDLHWLEMVSSKATHWGSLMVMHGERRTETFSETSRETLVETCWGWHMGTSKACTGALQL